MKQLDIDESPPARLTLTHHDVTCDPKTVTFDINQENVKWFWASLDILTGELWVPRRTLWDFAGHLCPAKKKTFAGHFYKGLLKCPARCNFFAGHFAQFPLAGHFVRREFTTSPDIWKIRPTCPARPADLTYSATNLTPVWILVKSQTEKSKYLQSPFDLWPTTLTYNPRQAKVKVDPNAKKIKVLGKSAQSCEHPQTDRQMLPSTLSHALLKLCGR